MKNSGWQDLSVAGRRANQYRPTQCQLLTNSSALEFSAHLYEVAVHRDHQREVLAVPMISKMRKSTRKPPYQH